MKPTPNRIVNYVLTTEDAFAIHTKTPWGPPHAEGDVHPLLIVRVNHPGDSDVAANVNGHLFANSDARLWKFDVVEGTGPGRWHWPARDADALGGGYAPDADADADTDDDKPAPRRRGRKPKTAAAD